MPKVLALIRRLPTIDRKAFRDHYEQCHVVVAKPLLVHLVRYARHHVEEEVVGPVDFDVVTAFQYPDREAIAGMFATLSGPAAEPILADERRFMDKPSNRFFEVSERPWKPGEEEERSLFVFVARPPGMTRAEHATRMLRDHWPSLLEQAAGLRFAILRDAFGMQGNPAPFDGLIQLAGEEGIDVRRFAARLGESGHRVVAVRTRRFLTPLEPA